MRELDPKDLVRELNEQSDLTHWPEIPGPGGSKNITSEDGISVGGCWCGRPWPHDWLGRKDGAPHPRYPE